MKKYSLFLIVVFLISISSSLKAQDDSKAKRDKEMQEAITQQKKALAEQKKAQAEAEEQLMKTDMDLKILSDSLEIPEQPGNRMIRLDYRKRPIRDFNFEEPFVVAQDMNGWMNHFGDNQSTTWDFSKSVKDNTFSKDYSFDVDKTSKSVVMSVMGDCKSGEIRIKIVMPNGKNYSDILIDESGNLNWRKSFTISETENKDKTGDWKFQISSTKATGFFKISLQTY